ncbi:MAG: hypothetical protein ACM3QS_14980 [Bacteroidota bacterium]
MSDQSGNAIQEASSVPATTAPAPNPILTRQQKLWRFLIGFLGWFLVNTLVWVAAGALAFRNDCFGFYECSHFFIFFALLIAVPGNVLVLILMAIKNRWVALGILGAISVNSVTGLIFGGWSFGVYEAVVPVTLYFFLN